MWNRLREWLWPTRIKGLENFAPHPTRTPQTASEKRLARIAALAGINAYNFVEFVNGDVQFNSESGGWVRVLSISAATLNAATDDELADYLVYDASKDAGVKA